MSNVLRMSHGRVVLCCWVCVLVCLPCLSLFMFGEYSSVLHVLYCGRAVCVFVLLCWCVRLLSLCVVWGVCLSLLCVVVVLLVLCCCWCFVVGVDAFRCFGVLVVVLVCGLCCCHCGLCLLFSVVVVYLIVGWVWFVWCGVLFALCLP